MGYIIAQPIEPLTKIVGRPDVTVFYWPRAAGPYNGITLERTHIKLRGGRVGLHNDRKPGYGPTTFRDLLLETGKGEAETSDWLARYYVDLGILMERVRCVDVTRPKQPTLLRDGHAIYLGYGIGLHLFKDLSFRNIPANALQLRHEFNRSDPLWKLAREIRVDGFHARECGQKRGAGRAGFALSVKDCGPNSTVSLSRIDIENVRQEDVRQSGKIHYDSFGAICVEHTKEVVLEECYVKHKKPDRSLVQYYDMANNTETSGPKNVFQLDHVELHGGQVDIRMEQGLERVEVLPFEGTADIAIRKRDKLGTWRVVRRYTAKEGFKWKA